MAEFWHNWAFVEKNRVMLHYSPLYSAFVHKFWGQQKHIMKEKGEGAEGEEEKEEEEEEEEEEEGGGEEEEENKNMKKGGLL